MGIRLKLVSSLAAILIVSTTILGTAFAFREQRTLVSLKRDHLQHSARLASTLLAGIAPGERERMIALWNQGGDTGPVYRVFVSGDHQEEASGLSEHNDGASEVMSATAPITASTDGEEWRVMTVETLPDTRTLLITNLGEHLALGVLLTGVAIIAVAWVCQRLVVRPVHWLITAADAMAQGDDWNPILPLTRNADEIGVLADHFADLSRRLASAVRSARHGSAHLVAVRVRRELDEPIRRLSTALATLEASGAGGVAERHEVQDMHAMIQELRGTCERLSEVSPDPDSARPQAHGSQGHRRTTGQE